MIRPILLLALVALMAMVVAACGSDPTPTPQPAAPAPAAAAEPEPEPEPSDAIPSASFRVLAGQSSYAPFIEGWREMVDVGTGGKISFTPQDATEQETMDFVLRNRSEYTANGVEKPGMIFRLNEDHVPLWDTAAELGLSPKEAIEANMNFTGGLEIDPRPMNLWMSFPAACMNWYTLDPEIKSIHDFEGKKVYMGSPGNTVYPVAVLLAEAAGIRGKFDEIIGGAKPGQDYLADRDVDVAGSGIIFAGHPLASATSAYNQIAQLTGSLFQVDSDLDVIKKAQANNPAWVANGLLPEVKLYRGDMSRAAKVDYDMVRAEEEWCTGSITVNFQTGPDSDENAIYHIGRSIVENIDLSDDYFPFISQTWKERFAHTWNPQSSFHPGIRRAYDEMGVTYGIEGIREWEAAFDREAFIAALP